MKTADTYWKKVQSIAASVLADADPDDARELADDYVENDGCLDVTIPDLKRIVGFSQNSDAFEVWDPESVKPGSLRWWWCRAFYAMTQDVYDSIDQKTA